MDIQQGGGPHVKWKMVYGKLTNVENNKIAITLQEIRTLCKVQYCMNKFNNTFFAKTQSKTLEVFSKW